MLITFKRFRLSVRSKDEYIVEKKLKELSIGYYKKRYDTEYKNHKITKVFFTDCSCSVDAFNELCSFIESENVYVILTEGAQSKI